MDPGIESRTALITGAAGSISFATAQMLLGKGARLLLTDIDEED